MSLNNRKKGQISLEAMLMLAVIFGLFLGMYLIYEQKIGEISSSREIINEEADCLKLANTLSQAFLLGDSTIMMAKINYNLTVQPSQQRIETKNSNCILPFSLIAQNESLTNQSFTLLPGKVKAENKKNMVFVNNI